MNRTRLSRLALTGEAIVIFITSPPLESQNSLTFQMYTAKEGCTELGG